MGENQPKASGDALVFPGQRMHSYSFPHLFFLVAKLSLYKAAAIVSHKLLDVTGLMLLSSLVLALCLPGGLPHFQRKAQGFPLGNCLIYVVLLAEPLQNNVLNAITLWGHGVQFPSVP